MIQPTENFSDIKNKEPIYLTIEEFGKKVIDGEFTDEAGVGYYANAAKISSVPVVLSEFFEDLEPKDEDLQMPKIRHRMADGTHVAWFPYA